MPYCYDPPLARGPHPPRRWAGWLSADPHALGRWANQLVVRSGLPWQLACLASELQGNSSLPHAVSWWAAKQILTTSPSEQVSNLHTLIMMKVYRKTERPPEVLRSTQIVIPTVPLVYTTHHTTCFTHLLDTPLHESNPVTSYSSQRIVGHNSNLLN